MSRYIDFRLGDWVSATTDSGKTFEGRANSFVSLNKKHSVVGLTDARTGKTVLVDKERLTPIPITPEMLTANGFEFNYPVSAGYGIRFERYSGKMFRVYGIRTDEGIIKWKLNVHFNEPNRYISLYRDVFYVHELQGIMRDCGLYDRADAFDPHVEPKNV